MQIWAETGKSALPIRNYSQILYQFLTFTQNLKRSRLCCGHISACENMTEIQHIESELCHFLIYLQFIDTS